MTLDFLWGRAWRLILVGALALGLRFFLGLPEVRQYYAVPYDKLVHIGVFGVMTFLLYWAVRWRLRWLLLVPTICAGLEEFIQRYEPGRSSDLWDFLAGFVGVCLTVLIIWLLRRFRRGSSSAPTQT